MQASQEEAPQEGTSQEGTSQEGTGFNQPCRHWAAGHCGWGRRCRFVHDLNATRVRDSVTTANVERAQKKGQRRKGARRGSYKAPQPGSAGPAPDFAGPDFYSAGPSGPVSLEPPLPPPPFPPPPFPPHPFPPPPPLAGVAPGSDHIHGNLMTGPPDLMMGPPTLKQVAIDTALSAGITGEIGLSVRDAMGIPDKPPGMEGLVPCGCGWPPPMHMQTPQLVPSLQTIRPKPPPQQPPAELGGFHAQCKSSGPPPQPEAQHVQPPPEPQHVEPPPEAEAQHVGPWVQHHAEGEPSPVEVILQDDASPIRSRTLVRGGEAASPCEERNRGTSPIRSRTLVRGGEAASPCEERNREDKMKKKEKKKEKKSRRRSTRRSSRRSRSRRRQHEPSRSRRRGRRDRTPSSAKSQPLRNRTTHREAYCSRRERSVRPREASRREAKRRSASPAGLAQRLSELSEYNGREISPESLALVLRCAKDETKRRLYEKIKQGRVPAMLLGNMPGSSEAPAAAPAPRPAPSGSGGWLGQLRQITELQAMTNSLIASHLSLPDRPPQ